jgi:glyoxylase-like metal-dependent hydrolase (beta-lactamase superfamily II)
MGALVFYCEAEQLLISDDAPWENGFGVVLPDQPGALAAAQDTLDRIAALDVTIVIPGHGQPFTGISAALDGCYERLEAFNADPIHMARHALKVMLMFTLLGRRQLPLATLTEYLDSIAVYREYNRTYLGLAPLALAEKLASELERAGAVRRNGGFLEPAVRKL